MSPAELFDTFQPEAPATAAQVATVAAIAQHSLPDSYERFLLFSNGGWGRSGEREFGLFGAEDVLRYHQEYEFEEYMPGAMPFALNGGGVFYVFDLRAPLHEGECPVFVCDAGANTWESATWLADSFTSACRGY